VVAGLKRSINHVIDANYENLFTLYVSVFIRSRIKQFCDNCKCLKILIIVTIGFVARVLLYKFIKIGPIDSQPRRNHKKTTATRFVVGTAVEI